MLSYMMQHFNLKSSSYCAFDALSATASTLGHGRTRTLSQSHHRILQVEICLWGRSIFKDDLNDVYFSGMPWASFLSLMSPMTKVFSLQGLRLQPFMSDWTEGWISRYTSPHASTNKNLLSRDWLDQLTTHAYTAAPDIVLCGNKVLLTRHHYEWNECFSFFNQVDLEGLRTVSSDRGRSMAAELGLPYFETSAATGQGWFKSSP